MSNHDDNPCHHRDRPISAGESLRTAVDEFRAGPLETMRAQTRLTAADLLRGAAQRELEARVMREMVSELRQNGPDAFAYPGTVLERVKSRRPQDPPRDPKPIVSR